MSDKDLQECIDNLGRCKCGSKPEMRDVKNIRYGRDFADYQVVCPNCEHCGKEQMTFYEAAESWEVLRFAENKENLAKHGEHDDGSVKVCDFLSGNIYCPYCGEEYEIFASRLFEAGDHDVSCADCCRDFEIYTEINYSFTSTRKDGAE